MKVSSDSIQQIMNIRPDLIDQKSYQTEDLVNTIEGLILRRTTTDIETVVGTEINKTIGSIIDIHV